MNTSSTPLATALAQTSRAASHWMFAAWIVALPLRWRALAVSRPVPPVYHDYTDFLLFSADIFAILTLLLWGISRLNSTRPLQFGPASLTLPLAGLFAVTLLTSLTSIDPGLSFYTFARMVLAAGMMVYVINEVRGIGELALPAGLSIGLQGVIAIWQSLTQGSVGLGALGEYPLDPTWAGVSVVTAGGIRFLRAYGLSDHPNILGGHLVFSLLIVLAAWKLRNVWGKPLLTGFTILGMVGLLLTFSRSAWLALLLSLVFIAVVLVVIRGREELIEYVKLAILAGVVAIPFLLYTAPYLGSRLNAGDSFQEIPQETQAIGERVLLMEATTRVFLQKPLTGSGAATVPQAMMPLYPEFPVYYQPAHHVLYQVSAETGIFGGLFYLLLMIHPWLAMALQRRRIFHLLAPTLRVDLVFSSALLLAVTVISFLDYYPWMLVPGRYWQYLAWGLWAGSYLRSIRPEQLLTPSKAG